MTPALLREEARGHQLVSDSVRIRPVGRSVGPRPPLRAARVQSPAVTGLGSAHAAAQRWAGNRGDRRDPEQDTRADRVDRCDRRPPRPAPRAPLSRSRDPEAAVTCARDKHGKMAPATLRGAAASQRSSADRGENKGGAAAGAGGRGARGAWGPGARGVAVPWAPRVLGTRPRATRSLWRDRAGPGSGSGSGRCPGPPCAPTPRAPPVAAHGAALFTPRAGGAGAVRVAAAGGGALPAAPPSGLGARTSSGPQFPPASARACHRRGCLWREGALASGAPWGSGPVGLRGPQASSTRRGRARPAQDPGPCTPGWAITVGSRGVPCPAPELNSFGQLDDASAPGEDPLLPLSQSGAAQELGLDSCFAEWRHPSPGRLPIGAHPGGKERRPGPQCPLRPQGPLFLLSSWMVGGEFGVKALSPLPRSDAPSPRAGPAKCTDTFARPSELGFPGH